MTVKKEEGVLEWSGEPRGAPAAPTTVVPKGNAGDQAKKVKGVQGENEMTQLTSRLARYAKQQHWGRMHEADPDSHRVITTSAAPSCTSGRVRVCPSHALLRERLHAGRNRCAKCMVF